VDDTTAPAFSPPPPLTKLCRVARLRDAVSTRTFGARSDRDRDLIRHGYLLALEEVERAAGTREEGAA